MDLLLEQVFVSRAHLLLNRVVLNDCSVLLDLRQIIAATQGGEWPIILRLEGR